jgi:hypothetical protein
MSPSVPVFHLAHAATAPNVPWVPAGPATDTLNYKIFTDESAEFTGFQASPPIIDFTDWPLDQGTINSIIGNPSFQVTSAITDTGYFELEFHMGQNNWGCQFNLGNAACGVQIRQAFAHAFDKSIFISTQLSGNAQPIDNPVPPSVDLNTPDPCAWDATHVQSGPNCIVNGAGGTAYHLAAATPGSGCVNTPAFAWTPGCGTPDFCAAADHLIAAGLATGKNPTTCVLTGLATTSITSNPMNIFVRSDNTPRLNAGNSYLQFMCGLFTGTFSTGCGISLSSTNIITAFPGDLGSFPGFTTSTMTMALTWDVYTGGFGNVLTFDSSLFYRYDSQFVSGVSQIKPPCSSKSIPTFAASDYMYLCNSSFDSNIEQAEFAPCLTAPGDPATGQTHLTVTFANCPSTSQLSSASAAYKAQDVYGQNVFSIPWWTGKNQFGYLTGWQGAVLNKSDGFTPPGNFFTMLNARNPSPPVPGTVRQGFKTGTTTVSPFITSPNQPWNEGVRGAIWDSPGTTNPDSPQAYLDWMTVKTDEIPVGSLSYTPPAGTVAAFRYTLRNDLFWHTGQKVTSWDLAFSYIAYQFTGVAPGLAPMTGIKVLSPTQVDIDVSAIGPFTKLFLSNPIIPGRDWVNNSVCTAAAWDAAIVNTNFAAANGALSSCIAPSSAVTSSGVIVPTGSNIDTAKIQPSYDPVASKNFIGSGPWMCGSGPIIGGPGCSSTGNQATFAGAQWTLTRYGFGTTPGGSLNSYFRSAGTLALWVWGRTTGVFSTDFLDFSAIDLCFGKPVGTSGCATWQSGIGANGPNTVIGLTQVSIVARFVGLNWVTPYDWRISPPQNIVTFPPVLHEGSVTLNPCSIDPVNGYDC